MRERFVEVACEALETCNRLAIVLAGISLDAFAPAKARHPDRVLNVGIREQAMIGVAAGLALEGMRPVVHTFAPFLVERPFESLKIDLAHQGVGAVLVSIGASHDFPAYGRTHQCPEDVALLDALGTWTVQVPGHPDEAAALLDAALAQDCLVYLRLSEATNREPFTVTGPGMTVLRRGARGTVVAVGPVLDAVREAVADQDITLLYASTVRPFDTATLRATLGEPAVALVEPYLAGTSVTAVNRALGDLAHRTCGLGVGYDGRSDLHRYGTRAEHDAAHGLDAAGLRARLTRFFDGIPDGATADPP